MASLSSPPFPVSDRGGVSGSGLGREPLSRAVEQVHLRCTRGSLQWLYPARALRVLLEPNVASARHGTVCIKPASDFQGANIYVERGGQLHLVLGEAQGARPRHVSCFSARSAQGVALFLQASPQRDISRRTASFQYELLSNQSAAGTDFKKMDLAEGTSRGSTFRAGLGWGWFIPGDRGCFGIAFCLAVPSLRTSSLLISWPCWYLHNKNFGLHLITVLSKLIVLPHFPSEFTCPFPMV